MHVPGIALFAKELHAYPKDPSKTVGDKAHCDVFVGLIFESETSPEISLEGTGVKNDVQSLLCGMGYWQLRKNNSKSPVIAPGDFFPSATFFNGSDYDTLVYLGLKPPE